MQSKNTKQLKEAFESWRAYTSINEQRDLPASVTTSKSTPEEPDVGPVPDEPQPSKASKKDSYAQFLKDIKGGYEVFLPLDEDIQEAKLKGGDELIVVKTAFRVYQVILNRNFNPPSKAFIEIPKSKLGPDGLPKHFGRIYSPREAVELGEKMLDSDKLTKKQRRAYKKLLPIMRNLAEGVIQFADDVVDLLEPPETLLGKIKQRYRMWRHKWDNTEFGRQIRNQIIEKIRYRTMVKKPLTKPKTKADFLSKEAELKSLEAESNKKIENLNRKKQRLERRSAGSSKPEKFTKRLKKVDIKVSFEKEKLKLYKELMKGLGSQAGLPDASAASKLASLLGRSTFGLLRSSSRLLLAIIPGIGMLTWIVNASLLATAMLIVVHLGTYLSAALGEVKQEGTFNGGLMLLAIAFAELGFEADDVLSMFRVTARRAMLKKRQGEELTYLEDIVHRSLQKTIASDEDEIIKTFMDQTRELSGDSYIDVFKDVYGLDESLIPNKKIKIILG